MKRYIYPILMLLAAVAWSPRPSFGREKLPPEDLEIVERRWPDAKQSFTGLRWVILEEGKGEQPKAGALVSVLYIGRLINDKIFDQSLNPAKPFKFRAGREMVVAGFDEAVLGMKKGERRMVIIPFELGYGSRGDPPKIPRKATLVFEMTLLDFDYSIPSPSKASEK